MKHKSLFAIFVFVSLSCLPLFAQDSSEIFKKFSELVKEYKETIDFSQKIAPTISTETQQATSQADTVQAPSLSEQKYSLAFLLASAKQNNYTLKAAIDSEAAAKAELDVAKARRLPSFTPSVSGTFIGNPLGPISIGAGQLGSYNGISIPNETILLYKGMEQSLYNFSLKAEIPLYTWGKISKGIELAQSGLEASSIQKEKAEHEIFVKIRASLDSLSYIITIEKILKLQQEICSRLLYISEKSADSGFITKAELANIQIKLKENDIALARIEETKDKLLSDLSSMSGLEISSVDKLEFSTPKAGSPSWTESESYILAINNNYDLILLDTLLDVKKGMKELAETEAKGLPDIGLQIELTYSGSRFPFLEKDWFGQDDYQITISLGSAGSTGGATKQGAAAKARAEYSQAQSQRLDAEKSIKAWLHETYLSLDLSKIKLEYAALKQDGWAEELEHKHSSLLVGAGDETEYLSTMIEALSNLAEAYQNLADYRAKIISIDLVVGKQASLP